MTVGGTSPGRGFWGIDLKNSVGVLLDHLSVSGVRRDNPIGGRTGLRFPVFGENIR